MFQLALAQMQVVPGEKARNLAEAARCIREAALAGAKVVLLPEALSLGWTHPSAFQAADEIPGGTSFQALASAARENRVHVCGGIVERADGKIFNSAVLISSEGRLLLHHRKINELDFARAIYSRGDRLQVADTELGRIGLMICADAFVEGQVISRSLAMMGVEVILSPCAWAVPADHDQAQEPYGQLWVDNYGPVCRDFKLWIAGCSNVGPITEGPWAGRRCIGNSLVLDPAGQVVARGAYDRAEIIYLPIGGQERKR